ncbi:MAG: LemA family protein [Magnetococcus sp. WYHC-3]
MAHTPDMDGLEALESETLNSERLRRMKRLVSEMYREELGRSQLRLPPIRARMLIVSLSFISMLVFGVTTLYNFNRFVTLEERVLSAHAHVEDVVQRRVNLFHNLINIALNQAAVERDVFRHVADTRSKLGRSAPSATPEDAAVQGRNAVPPTAETRPLGSEGEHLLASLLGLEEKLAQGAPLGQLLAVVEQYPSITSALTYQQLMDKLVEIEDRITKRRDEYNEEVRLYNTLITSFPWYVLAKVCGFERFDYFTARDMDSGSSLSVPRLDHRIYQQLLPGAGAPPPAPPAAGAPPPAPPAAAVDVPGVGTAPGKVP